MSDSAERLLVSTYTPHTQSTDCVRLLMQCNKTVLSPLLWWSELGIMCTVLDTDVDDQCDKLAKVVGGTGIVEIC